MGQVERAHPNTEPGRGERHNVVSAGGPSRESHTVAAPVANYARVSEPGSARNYYRPSGTRPSISIGSRSRAIRNLAPVPFDPRHSIRKLLTPARCPLKNEHARVSVIEMQSDPSSPTIRERANRTLQFFPRRGSTGCRTVNECADELSSRLTLTNIVNPIRVPCDIVLAPCNLLCRKIAPRDFID